MSITRLNAGLEGLMALLLASILLLPLGCGGDDPTASATVVSIAVEGPPGGTTTVGESGPSFAVATFSDGTTKDGTSDAAWTWCNTSFITISAARQGQAAGVSPSESCQM